MALLALYGGIGTPRGDYSGKVANVSVPDVTGLSQEDAETTLVAEGLVLGTVTEANSDVVASGLVISQDPAADEVVSPGSAVDIVVSLGAGRPDGAPGKRARGACKYPRRVYIDGRVYWVKTPEEERELLRQWRESLEAERAALERKNAPAGQVAKVRVKVARAQSRIEAVDDREAQWHEHLCYEDEDVLTMYGALH